MGPLVDFLQVFGIVAQYTMPRTLEQNDIIERRNITPMDMVRSMMTLKHVRFL